MKFVCERCQTRYSIADDKVRQKILKIRCKTCDNVITLRDSSGGASAAESPAPSVSLPAVSLSSSAVMPASQPLRRDSAVRPVAAAASAPASKPASSPPAGLVPPKSVAPSSSKAGAARPATVPPVPAGARPSQPSLPAAAPGPVEWFLALNGSESGPWGRVELARKILAARTQAGDDAELDCYVWKEGQGEWKPPADVPEIARELTAQKGRTTIPPARPVPPRPPLPAAVAKPASVPPPPAALEAFPEDEATQIQTLDPGLTSGPLPSPGGGGPRHSQPLAAALGSPSNAAAAGGPTPRPRSSSAMPAVGASPAAPSVAAPYAKGLSTGLEGLDLTPRPIAQPGFAAPSPAGFVAAPAVPVESLPIVVPARRPALKYAVAGVAVLALGAGAYVLVSSSSPSSSAPAPAGSAVATPTPSAAPAATPPAAPSDQAAVAVDPEEEARRAADAWFGAPNRSAPSKAVVGGGSKPGLIKRLFGKGDKPGRPATTPPPAQATAPPPASFNGTDPDERRVAGVSAPERRVTAYANNVTSGPTVSQESISQVIHSKPNQDAIKSCYNRALKLGGSQLKGRVDVTVSIGMSGRVKNVQLSSSSGLDMVHSCIKGVVQRWNFPPSGEEYGTAFPLILASQGG